MIDSWDTKCDRQNFLSIWTIFCPFSTVTAWKITILKNWKKRHDKLIILHICTINDNHIMYDSWATKCDRQNFLSFWTIFCSFSTQSTWKNTILKTSQFWKIEKTARINYHFTHLHHKWQSYCVWFLRYSMWQTEIFVILDNFLPF